MGEGGRDTASAEPRDVGTGGTVRTMPIRTPKRIASWMPRRVRAAVVAARNAADDATKELQDNGEEWNGEGPRAERKPKDGSEKPRQLAVPYRNYRHYRG